MNINKLYVAWLLTFGHSIRKSINNKVENLDWNKLELFLLKLAEETRHKIHPNSGQNIKLNREPITTTPHRPGNIHLETYNIIALYL